MSHQNYYIDNPRGVLATLRDLVPQRRTGFGESLRIAELQAARFRELLRDPNAPALPEEVVSRLPRISVTRVFLPTSGMSYWSDGTWNIQLNRVESAARQRFTLMHEWKHIIDHGHAANLYVGTPRRSPDEQAEQAADYFAGCVLMPKKLMQRAWADGIQKPHELARLFDVSARAAEVRLAQLGLTEPRPRCAPAPPVARRGRYYRPLSLNYAKGLAA